ncbi:hydroxyisourate hydrolase [Demequina sp. SYSU T00192]|uniref:5-hydroxyisourate hydrolase n=1 Tax=Demequina litoralis TaxID=3051660 RepID=A0ABT8G6M1_9MICO|nr:hydroxyisourate hydrolase [Demequina sp. SYSU T00192]MDN4474771.1 hydroxyisourate hydrolase [Demequina sp. SYSU T00192]
MSHVTTHVLDSVRGRPAAGMHVRLLHGDVELATGTTDADGRVSDLGPDRLHTGTYQLVFATGEWFADHGVATFYPEVRLAFGVADDAHYHVPLLLSPFGYSTYRGS